MKNGWGQHTDALDLRNRSLVVGYSFINVYFFFSADIILEKMMGRWYPEQTVQQVRMAWAVPFDVAVSCRSPKSIPDGSFLKFL